MSEPAAQAQGTLAGPEQTSRVPSGTDLPEGPNSGGLFHAGHVYETITRFGAGQPLVVIPHDYPRTLEAGPSSDHAPAFFYLVGHVTQYRLDEGGPLVFVVDEIVPGPRQEIPAHLVGFLQPLRGGGEQPWEPGRQPAPGHPWALVLTRRQRPPLAFLMGVEERRCAGLLTCRPAPLPHTLHRPAGRSIQIKAEDLSPTNGARSRANLAIDPRKEARLSISAPQVQQSPRSIVISADEIKKPSVEQTSPDGQQPRPVIHVRERPSWHKAWLSHGGRQARAAAEKVRVWLVSHGPVPIRTNEPFCVYCGQPLGELLERCPVCQAALHPACRAQARGCVTVGCSSGPHADERPPLVVDLVED